MLASNSLRLQGVTKYYAGLCVLDNINITLHLGERIVLVGENGAGKTTLARIIAGEETPDEGHIQRPDTLRLGYLPQTLQHSPSSTVEDVLTSMLTHLSQLARELHQLEIAMRDAPPNSDEIAHLMAHYSHIQETFILQGGYDIEARRDKVFTGLNIDNIAPERPFHTLSGGERTRLALASLLIAQPDLLLLDEPTNHLDFEGIAWLEAYLAQWHGTLMVITHDRHFINKIANRIVELNPKTHQLDTYYGDYEAYLAQRQRNYEDAVQNYHAQQSQITQLKRHAKQIAHSTSTRGVFSDSGDKFLKHFKRERGERLISKNLQDTRQRLADLEADRLENPRHTWRINFDFNPEPLTSDHPLIITGLSKSFARRTLFTDVNLTLQRHERMVLVAPNGAGKSTLLKCVMNKIQPDAGHVRSMGQVKVGYLGQDSLLDHENRTVLDVLRQIMPADDKTLQAYLHRHGLFTSDHLLNVYVGDLSTGQRRKLDLACLPASRANVLLLDEPTNHIDLTSLEALEAALMQFDGAILAVTHDRRFIERVATQVWELKEGRVTRLKS